jgi:ATP-dependent Lhr-like helicase
MVSDRLADRREAVAPDDVAWLAAEAGVNHEAAQQVLAYLDDGRRALDAIPTQQTLVLERFFDESGGMQLVLHAPFGSRINKAWCLALRKKFCRQFNFELQAAATEDAILLSLGPQHSFPLADVFRYLIRRRARRARAGVSRRAGVQDALALERHHLAGGAAGARQPPGGAAAAADAGRRPDGVGVSRRRGVPGEHPRRSAAADHPLVNQTVRDCLQEAMDFDGLRTILTSIHRGELRLLARDTPEPSVFASAILNASRMRSWTTRRSRSGGCMPCRRGAAGTTGRWRKAPCSTPRPSRRCGRKRRRSRDADELHDALMTCGAFTEGELASFDPPRGATR